MRDLLEQTTTFQPANNFIKEIKLPKHKSKKLINILDKCSTSIFIRFTAEGIIETIEPDKIIEQPFENVKDFSNDDYTY